MQAEHTTQSGFSAILALVLLMVVVVLVGVGWYWWSGRGEQNDNVRARITSFEECVAAGNPIMETYPEQCRADGQTFVNESQQGTEHTLPPQ